MSTVKHYAYHSCNHRSCPCCGGRELQLWAARQQARRLRVATAERFLARLRGGHPSFYEEIDPEVCHIDWNVNLKPVGRGKSALRYLAAHDGH